MTRFKLILFLLFISASVSSQTNWDTYLSDITPLQFDLPGNDVYYTLNEDLEYPYETFYNESEDYELVITPFSGNAYEYNIDLDDEIRSIAADLEYRNYSLFLEKLLSSNIKSKYAISYDDDYECIVIYGVIDHKKSKTLFDIELICWNISVYDAAIIIGSIDLD